MNVAFFNCINYVIILPTFFYINIKKNQILMGIQTHDDFAPPFPSIGLHLIPLRAAFFPALK